MRRRVVRWTLAVLALFALGGGALYLGRFELFRLQASLPPYTAPAGPEAVAWVPMRDGVKLHAETFVPLGPGPWPTILVRNPYLPLRSLERFQCQVLTRYGYACVLEDVRGQLDSEGTWDPIVNERRDGLDTVAWLVKQPFVDGNLAMRGPSYLTCAQLAMADVLPPEVKTLVPSVFGVDFRLVAYERGLFRHDVLTAWATLMPGRGMRLTAQGDYLAAAAAIPAATADERYMTRALPWYRELLEAEAPSAPYWHTPRQQVFRAVPERAGVPMLFFASLFDPFFAAELDTWQRLRTRDRSVLVLGPWDHVGMVAGEAPVKVPTGRLDPWPLMLEWFDHHLKGKPLTTLQPGTVRSLAPGDDAWRVRPAWPPPAPVTALHLGRAPEAQGCQGGSLEPAPAPASETRYRFDPADPAPTQGGASLLSHVFFKPSAVGAGPADQGRSCERADVLTFRSAPLPRATRLAGAARLTLRVRSTAPDTAFVARLIAERDGRALLVREDAATLAFPTAADDAPRTYLPGEAATVVVDFWPVEWVLPEGTRLRLDLTSSSFPALHTHANRAGPWARQTGADVATQTVEVGEGRAVLELPLAPP